MLSKMIDTIKNALYRHHVIAWLKYNNYLDVETMMMQMSMNFVDVFMHTSSDLECCEPVQ